MGEKSKLHFKSILTKDDRIDNNLLELYQFQTHGYAWFETYKISLRETFNWYLKLEEQEKSSEIDASITIFAFAEYITQMKDGIMMSQSEIIRPNQLGIDKDDFDFIDDSSIQ